MSVEGVESLRHKLQRMRVEQRADLGAHIEESLRTIEVEAWSAAPRDEGELKASMFSRMDSDISGRAGSEGTTHARHVHFGRKATGTNRGTAPVPYLFVPFEIERKKFMRRVRKSGRALYRRLSSL